MAATLCGIETTEEQVRAVATPPATFSHYPIPHGDFIQQVRAGANRAGLVPNREKFSLACVGNQLFGVMTCDSDTNDQQICLGLRHSHNKSIAGGLCAGVNIFVCDNLIFSGEVVIRRKHTRNMVQDLPYMIDSLFKQLPSYINRQTDQIDRFKLAKINNIQASYLMISAMKRGAFPASKLPLVLEQWERPNYDAFQPRTAWSLLNAFTQVNKLRSASMQFQSADLFRLFSDRLNVLQ